jgi:hypothetical protein
MEFLPVDIPRSYKRMVLVHAEGNVPRVAVEELMWNVKTLHCINKPIIPLGEHRVVEGCVLQVRP